MAAATSGPSGGAMRSGALERVAVVAIGHTPAGSFCARLFAGHGSEVAIVAHPGEAPEGAAGAFYHGATRRLDPGSPEAVEAVANADVLIRSSADGPVDPPADAGGAEDAPDRIEVVISPFGSSGPRAAWRSSGLVDQALSGHLRLTGDPAREPLQGVPDLEQHAIGVAAFVGALAALVARVRGAPGQRVELSHQEVLAALHQFTLCRYTHAGARLQRHGNRYAGPGAVIQAYRCRDGWISLTLATLDMVERMLHVTGLIAMTERPDVGSVADLMVDVELLNSELIPHLETQDRADLVELWQALRLPIAPIATLEEVLADPHLAERDFWIDGGSLPRVDGADGSGPGLRLPGPPYRLDGHHWRSGPSTRRSDAPSLVAAPVPGGGREPADDLADGPLTGLRVLDLTRVWAGPLAARILADLGAEVVCIETPWTRSGREVPDSYVEATHFFPDDDAGPDPWNRVAFHNKYAINKRSAVVELDKPEGVELLRALVPTADALVENYSPRVMPGFGLDETALHELNPDLVYLTMPGYGRTGPNADWVAYGPTIDGHVGHAALTGYRGEGPWKCGIAWPDPIGGLHGAAGALVALLDRLAEAEHRGRTVEVAQAESAVTMIGRHLAEAQLDGSPPRRGNRHVHHAPQGVYPCRGDDRWIALTVDGEEAWRATCRILDLGPEAARLDRAARMAAHDQLDRRLAEATRHRDDAALMRQLQEAGVAAGIVADAADVLADPQLAATDFFAELAHPSAGTHRWPRLPIRLSATPATIRSPAPCMGADNEYAARTLAGLDAERYRELVDRGVLRTEPPDG